MILAKTGLWRTLGGYWKPYRYTFSRGYTVCDGSLLPAGMTLAILGLPTALVLALIGPGLPLWIVAALLVAALTARFKPRAMVTKGRVHLDFFDRDPRNMPHRLAKQYRFMQQSQRRGASTVRKNIEGYMLEAELWADGHWSDFTADAAVILAQRIDRWVACYASPYRRGLTGE